MAARQKGAAAGQEVGPLLLKCSHRSKTATWPGTPGPPCFPSLRPRPGAREPLPPQALLPAPFPGARRARDPPPGFGQTQLEPGPCRATRAPPGGGVSPLRTPRPRCPPPPVRLRGLAAGVTRAGSCSGAAEDASGTTPARLRPGRPWPVPDSASSCRGFGWPAGAGPARGRGGREGRRPQRLSAPLPSAPRGRGNGREEGAGEEWPRGEPPAGAPGAWAAPGSAGKLPLRGGGLAPGQGGPEGEGGSLLRASPPHRIPQGALRRQPTCE